MSVVPTIGKPYYLEKSSTEPQALKWNESAIKNFKYSLTPSGKTVPAGMMWGSSNEWVLLGAFRNFAIELSKIAK